MRSLTALVAALAFASIGTVMAAGVPAVGSVEVRVVGLVMLVTTLAASLLVLYFDWRAKLRRRILADESHFTPFETRPLLDN